MTESSETLPSIINEVVLATRAFYLERRHKPRAIVCTRRFSDDLKMLADRVDSTARVDGCEPMLFGLVIRIDNRVNRFKLEP